MKYTWTYLRFELFLIWNNPFLRMQFIACALFSPFFFIMPDTTANGNQFPASFTILPIFCLANGIYYYPFSKLSTIMDRLSTIPFNFVQHFRLNYILFLLIIAIVIVAVYVVKQPNIESIALMACMAVVLVLINFIFSYLGSRRLELHSAWKMQFNGFNPVFLFVGIGVVMSIYMLSIFGLKYVMGNVWFTYALIGITCIIVIVHWFLIPSIMEEYKAQKHKKLELYREQ
ncbi:MAG: hypothetical protein NW207_07370 [Cytophagales bacterium]|nr:hypothetical protein [Cytophagales bacterium]